jgi:hypothetical protein
MEESMIDVERKLKAAVDELEALKAKNQSEVQFLQDRRQNLGLAPN